MGKYYRVSLNCARVHDNSPFSNICGFIEIWPLKSQIYKKGFFGVKCVPTIEYKGWYYLIAEQVDDHFEDIVLGKRIDYDPSGIVDITTASFDDLLSNLKHGLTCYSATEVDCDFVKHALEKIKSDENILNKYKDELYELGRKENVIKELVRRMDSEKINENKNVKKRSLREKSA